MAKKKREPDSPEFQRFNDAMDQLLAVSKEESDRQLAEVRGRRRQEREKKKDPR